MKPRGFTDHHVPELAGKVALAADLRPFKTYARAEA
jgi:hypothetical protein